METPYRVLLICKDGLKVITNSEVLFGDKEQLLGSHHSIDGSIFHLVKQTPVGFIYKEQ